MPISPPEVLRIVNEKWPVRNADKLGERWGEAVQTALSSIFAPLTVLGSEVDRRIIARAIRRAGCYLKDRAPTLYVTERFLRSVADAEYDAGLPPDLQGRRFEHVVPIKFSLPESCFAQDPAGAIAAPQGDDFADLPWLNRVARAILTPVAYVSRHEDVRLNRLSTPNWERPFSRYLDPTIVRDSPEPIVVYETRTGRRIEQLQNFTWSDHIALMEASPVFKPGLEAVRYFFQSLLVHQSGLLSNIEARSVPAVWPEPILVQDRLGRYSAEERAQLQTALRRLAYEGPNLGGRQIFEIPANRERLTMTVRHPEQVDRILLRLNIGPTFGKRELYFNDRNMHPSGRSLIQRVSDKVNASASPIVLMPQRINGTRRFGVDIGWSQKKRGQQAAMMEQALDEIVPAIAELHGNPV